MLQDNYLGVYRVRVNKYRLNTQLINSLIEVLEGRATFRYSLHKARIYLEVYHRPLDSEVLEDFNARSFKVELVKETTIE